MDFAGKNSLGKGNSTKTNTPLGIKSIFNCKNSPEDEFSFLPDPYWELNDFGRESLGIINLNDLELGRESLGITNINATDFIKTSLPDITVTDFTKNNSNDMQTLNNAFLFSATKNVTTSTSSSISSVNSVNPSFNSASLDSSIPSIITSCSSPRSDILNEVFIDSSDFLKQLQLYGKSTMATMRSKLDLKSKNANNHPRIKSLPSTLEGTLNSHQSQPPKSFCCFFNEPKDTFNDSVFIEAYHLATRIEDGSILELGSRENDMLDCIQEPEDLNKLSVEEKSPRHETVKPTESSSLFPNVLQEQSSHFSSKISLAQDESNCSSINKSKSKNPKEILNSLSEIINGENSINDRQKSDCQNMISNLAEILASSGSSKSDNLNLDDSGHSSIENEPVGNSEKLECYEVLDLSRKSQLDVSIISLNESNENCGPLDLSLKSNSEKCYSNPKILAPLVNTSQTKSVVKDFNSMRSSNYSVSSNENKSLGEITNKFKLKKTEDKQNLKKGPLKAVGPINNMTKKKNSTTTNSKLLTTPTRTETNFKLKKTSTPVNEHVIKPVAQSTPESLYSASPFNKSSNLNDKNSKDTKQKFNYSEAGSNLPINVSQKLKAKQFFTRERSADDIKKKLQNAKKLNRSYTAGETSKPISNPTRLKRGQITNTESKEKKSKIVTKSSLHKFKK